MEEKKCFFKLSNITPEIRCRRLSWCGIEKLKWAVTYHSDRCLHRWQHAERVLTAAYHLCSSSRNGNLHSLLCILVMSFVARSEAGCKPLRTVVLPEIPTFPAGKFPWISTQTSLLLVRWLLEWKGLALDKRMNFLNKPVHFLEGTNTNKSRLTEGVG